MENLLTAIKSNAWPFLEAQKILERIEKAPPSKGYILFETGYGPSGLPHIGTFAEVARTIMIIEALRKISTIPVKLICFSDDMDSLRKVPNNIPNQDLIRSNLGKPLTSIPDPFEEEESYGHYMNKKLRSFLDCFGFEYEFVSSTNCYKSGFFDHMLLRVLEKYNEIMNLMLPTFREVRKATYSPLMPICCDSGLILQVPIDKIDLKKKTLFYRNLSDKLVEVPVTGGACKLQWKVDFPMRWAAFEVDYEMYGKDHTPNAKIYSSICRILGGVEPLQFFYELFLNEDGSRISKSKGNSTITMDKWLKYAPLESIALFIYQTPNRAKKLHFNLIPQNVDDYLSLNKKYFLEVERSKQLANPVYHIHKGIVPKVETFNINFSLIINLASVCNPCNQKILWGFITKYTKGKAKPTNAPFLNTLVKFAICYYNDFLKFKKIYIQPNNIYTAILQDILEVLEELPIDSNSEDIQNKIYQIGKQHIGNNLQEYFKNLYLILLGQISGPRIGSFIELLGLDKTKQLIKTKINNYDS